MLVVVIIIAVATAIKSQCTPTTLHNITIEKNKSSTLLYLSFSGRFSLLPIVLLWCSLSFLPSAAAIIHYFRLIVAILPSLVMILCICLCAHTHSLIHSSIYMSMRFASCLYLLFAFLTCAIMMSVRVSVSICLLFCRFVVYNIAAPSIYAIFLPGH